MSLNSNFPAYHYLWYVCTICRASLPATPSVTTVDFIPGPPVQMSPHLCAFIYHQRSPFKWMISARRLSKTQTYARTSDKSWTNLAVFNKTTSKGFLTKLPASHTHRIVPINVNPSEAESLQTLARQHTRNTIRIPSTWLQSGGWYQTSILLPRDISSFRPVSGARHDKNFSPVQKYYFTFTRLHACPYIHFKHYIRLRIAEDCGSMSKEISPLVSIFGILLVRRRDAGPTKPQ